MQNLSRNIYHRPARRKFDDREEYKTFWEIKNLYQKTHLEEGFQRLGGVFHGSGWSSANSRFYKDKA